MELIERAFAREGGRCKLCDGRPETIAYLIRPEYGGRFELANVMAVCRRCMRRQAREAEWLGTAGPKLAAGTLEALPEVRLRGTGVMSRRACMRSHPSNAHRAELDSAL